jgi:hypothetical protein
VLVLKYFVRDQFARFSLKHAGLCYISVIDIIFKVTKDYENKLEFTVVNFLLGSYF